MFKNLKKAYTYAKDKAHQCGQYIQRKASVIGASLGIGSLTVASNAQAAVPASVTSAITDAVTDVGTVGGLVIGVVVIVFAFAMMRKPMNS